VSVNDEDHKLLQFLAATMESIRDRMATKDDIAAVREEMATKDDILSIREEMATKDEILSIRQEMATKEDIRAIREEMATKKDMLSVREEMASHVTAIRGDIERVHIRIDSVDRMLTTRLDGMDNQISRLRSVVYLLGKDQPDVLRLLGGVPP
jgi:hypothetical protein